MMEGRKDGGGHGGARDRGGKRRASKPAGAKDNRITEGEDFSFFFKFFSFLSYSDVFPIAWMNRALFFPNMLILSQ